MNIMDYKGAKNIYSQPTLKRTNPFSRLFELTDDRGIMVYKCTMLTIYIH